MLQHSTPDLSTNPYNIYSGVTNLESWYIDPYSFFNKYYRKISNIRRTKSPNLNASRLAVVFAQSSEASC